MNAIIIDRKKEVIRNKKKLEEKLNVKIIIREKSVLIEGDPLNEYEASIVLDAIDSGFSTEAALNILKEDIAFEKINIKDYTKRKNLSVIKGRIIGTHGKTKKTLEQITGCNIKIKDNYVSIIGDAEEVKNTITAIISIIRGSKQSNTYKFLERINARNKTRLNEI